MYISEILQWKGDKKTAFSVNFLIKPQFLVFFWVEAAVKKKQIFVRGKEAERLRFHKASKLPSKSNNADFICFMKDWARASNLICPRAAPPNVC